MNFIEVENVKKSFGDLEALREIDIEVEEGEIVGILGPNGAGKSTLIKILTGQIERDSGRVEVLDLDPEEDSLELKRRIGVLPEREDPPSFITGKEYLEMVSDIRETEISKNKWVKKLDLEGKMDKLTRDLSKGERQKLMIAQAFFHEPDLVFVDEPLINLDPLIQEEVKKLFQEHKDEKRTVFLCTHVVSLAEELCDRVYFLKDGKVIENIKEVENLKQQFLEEE